MIRRWAGNLGVFLILVGINGVVNAQEATLEVGKFSSGELSDWESEEFEGQTQYRLVEEDGKTVLQAVSQGSASGLGKEQRIDLQTYPYLNWSWKVSNRLPPRDETTKAGDDYPARVYLVVSGGLLFWRTKAVNYVWARTQEKGSTWPNAFAENNVLMIAVRDGEDETGIWHREKRNVLEDLQQYVDPDIRYIDGIALMTDSDNTGASTTSYYGDIFFSRE